MDSFWHDGCTVYTCAMDANRAVEMPLGNGKSNFSQYVQFIDKAYCV